MAARKDDFEKVLAAYKVLGLETGADDGEIKRAYRDMSRKTHPDKNPDDPKAGEKFDAVNKAYEALMDASLRAQFAQKLAAREAGRARVKEMDEARQKMRSQLEAREKAAATSAGAKAAVSGATAAASAQHAYEERIARLRREGRDLLAEEEYRRQRARLDEADRVARASAAAYGSRDTGAPGGPTEGGGDAAAAPAFNLAATVRLKWGEDVNEAAGSEVLPADASSTKAGALGPGAAAVRRTLSEEQIEVIVRPYGRALAVLSRRPTSACVVMHTAEAARALVAQPPAGFRAAPLVGEGAQASSGTHVHTRRGEGSVLAGTAPEGTATTGIKRPRSAVPGLTSAGGASALDEEGGDRAEVSVRAIDRRAGAAAAIGAGAESFIAAAAAARREGGGARSLHIGGLGGTGPQRAIDAVDAGIGDNGVALPTPAQNAAFDAREADVLARLQAFAGVAIG